MAHKSTRWNRAACGGCDLIQSIIALLFSFVLPLACLKMLHLCLGLVSGRVWGREVPRFAYKSQMYG